MLPALCRPRAQQNLGELDGVVRLEHSNVVQDLQVLCMPLSRGNSAVGAGGWADLYALDLQPRQRHQVELDGFLVNVLVDLHDRSSQRVETNACVVK